ncbi:NADH-quinone oxidoreductase subunit A [Candidatus Oscillochloris fontis]|uniref:NADH-quinone oxidoreductase subunit A n=1 Tax=Candidatus Oscillochloris fontis TaxID=2496868 RepID=UPI00101D19F6|nr:NADH-quinone oxidoreductase subunit A [Candidatus Oscillochloris fontis]
MLANYAFIGVFFVAALSFPVIPLLLAFLLRPKRPAPLKLSTYECGLEAIGDIRVQFKVQYYLYALAFVIFDVEVVFLYPWAVAFHKVGLYGFTAAAVFLAMLFAGLIYEWRKGALEWV